MSAHLLSSTSRLRRAEAGFKSLAESIAVLAWVATGCCCTLLLH